MKSGEELIADGTSEVGVLFADIEGFTLLSASIEPDELVHLLDDVFSVFDADGGGGCCRRIMRR